MYNAVRYNDSNSLETKSLACLGQAKVYSDQMFCGIGNTKDELRWLMNGGDEKRRRPSWLVFTTFASFFLFTLSIRCPKLK